MLLTAPHTDLGNAERFVRYSEDNLIFVSSAKKWYRFDGTRYAQDDGSLIVHISKEILRTSQELAKELSDESIRKSLLTHLKKSESKAKIEAMANLSQGLLLVKPESLDADPFLFNVKNGTVNLRTGELQTHNKKNLISKIVDIKFDPYSDCPLFKKFLTDVFADDKDVVKYVQKVVGYSLSADTSEQSMFILCGAGSNGKSTFISLLKSLTGDYCRSSDISTFTFSKSEQIRNDLARLYDARVVTSVEVQEGKFLDESIIKTVTGGDPVTSRFLFNELFEYVP